MYRHCILISSAFSIGKRIALHIITDDHEEDYVYKQIKYIYSKCGEDTYFGSHYIVTPSKDFQSVIDHDPFFDRIMVIDDINEFIKYILIDKNTSAIDIAKFILANVSCTHLKLQKLLYLCYAEYLVQTKNKLFNDEIYVFQYGPVIKSVFDKYKGRRDSLEPDNEAYHSFKYLDAAKARIFVSRDSFNKLRILNEVLDKYKDYSASQLVNLTHQNNSPWAVARGCGKEIIDDDTIIKYHINEIAN